MAKKKKRASKRTTHGTARRGRPPGSKNKVSNKMAKKTREITQSESATHIDLRAAKPVSVRIHIDGDTGTSTDITVSAKGIDRVPTSQVLRGAAAELLAAATYIEREDDRDALDAPIPFVPVMLARPQDPSVAAQTGAEDAQEDLRD